MIEDRIVVDRGNNDALMASLLSKNNSDPALTSLLANGGGNGMWNNPFIYLVWMMFAGRFFNNGELGANGAQNVELQSQLSDMRSQMATNQNTNLLMDALKGNSSSIHELASNLNCDFNTLNSSICGVQSAIATVGGQVGYSAERVINAANLGDCRIIEAINGCCCNTQKAIIETAGENRLAICQLTNSITNSITNGFNNMTTGLNNLSFQNQQLTCSLQQSITGATQAIKDMLGNHWADELRDRNFQYSQDALTNYIINQLKTTTAA